MENFQTKVYVYRRISKYEPIRGKSYSRIKWRKSFRAISKKLHYLVVGDSKPTKRKIDQAKN